jgi:hypothetical protein
MRARAAEDQLIFVNERIRQPVGDEGGSVPTSSKEE